MGGTMRAWLACMIVAAGATLGAADERALRELVERLGSSRLAERMEAQQALHAAGDAAIALLKEASKSADLEIAFRARHVLEQLESGIGPNTPADLVAAIGRYRFGDLNAKLAAVDVFVKYGEFTRLRTLVDAETDRTIREQLNRKLLGVVEQEIAQLIVQGKFDEAIKQLEQGLPRGTAPHLAVCLHLRGLSVSRIAQLKAQPTVDPLAVEGQLLRALHRLEKDWPAANELAKQSGDEKAVLTSYYDVHDWPRIEQKIAGTAVSGNADVSVRLRLRAALSVASQARGDNAQVDSLKKELDELLTATETQSDAALNTAAQLLQLAGRPFDAVTLLQGRQRRAIFDILRYQGRHREAFAALALNDPRQNALTWFASLDAEGADENVFQASHPVQLGISAAKSLYLLGEKELAEKLFTAIAQVKPRKSPPRDLLRLVVNAEIELGMDELTLEHAAQYLAADPKNVNLTVLFRQPAPWIQPWWNLLDKLGGERSPREQFRDLRALALTAFRKQLDDTAWQTFVTGVDSLAKQENDAKKRGIEYYAPLAQAAQLRGDIETAKKYWRMAAELQTPNAWLKLGDLLASRQAWVEAAESFSQAALASPRTALPLYLQGHALLKAARQDEGQRLIDQARLIPLAHVQARFDLARELKERGLTREASQEWDLIMRIATTDDWSYYLAAQEQAVVLSGTASAEAANLWQRLRLRLLQVPAGIERDGLLRVPHNVAKLQASTLLAKGQASDAVNTLAQAQSILIDDVQLPIEFWSRLEQADQRAAAEKLFETAFAQLDETCRLFPRSAMHHNNLAWLGGKCRRRLDEALAHAQQAIELRKDFAPYLDTLAEVHFQRGSRDEALKIARRCVELDPINPLYKQQIERFSATENK